jgi:hypothetical protein
MNNCYKCGDTKEFFIEEILSEKTGAVFMKRFICIKCAAQIIAEDDALFKQFCEGYDEK